MYKFTNRLTDFWATLYHSDDKINKTEMGRGTYHLLRRIKIGTGFWKGNEKGRGHFESLNIETRIILKYT
jgi:hypothetical protein